MKNSNNKLYFKSYISGKMYKVYSLIDLKLFKNELKQNNLTMEEYAEKYYKCLNKIDPTYKLKNDEFYYICNIKKCDETYNKFLYNKKFTCEICKNFCCSKYENFMSHIKRIHKLNIIEYLNLNGYKDLTKEIKYCKYCGKEGRYLIEFDHKNKIYKKVNQVHFCYSDECKDKVCKKYFNKPYKESIKLFEHLGGKTEFLCELYNTTPEGLKVLGKSKSAKNPKNQCIIRGEYIKKYGRELGLKKFKEEFPYHKISKGQKELYNILN